MGSAFSGKGILVRAKPGGKEQGRRYSSMHLAFPGTFVLTLLSFPFSLLRQRSAETLINSQLGMPGDR